MPPITGWHIDLYERDGSIFRFSPEDPPIVNKS
jgi:hypothetical protein